MVDKVFQVSAMWFSRSSLWRLWFSGSGTFSVQRKQKVWGRKWSEIAYVSCSRTNLCLSVVLVRGLGAPVGTCLQHELQIEGLSVFSSIIHTVVVFDNLQLSLGEKQKQQSGDYRQGQSLKTRYVWVMARSVNQTLIVYWHQLKIY